MIARILIFLISGIRPMLGPDACRFPETCGKFAIRILAEQPLLSALTIITKRVLSCF